MADKIVIDASAALKWQFKDEPHTDSAVNLFLDYKDGKMIFIVPQLFYYEIANAIHIASMRKRITEDEGRAVLMDMIEIETSVIDSTELLKTSYSNAKKYGISVYDAIYLTLAKEQGILLYTGDKRFYNSVKDKKTIRWIGDYKT